LKLNNIIILGAGIAGTGLSFNLKRLGYTGKITLLDSNEIAANKAHSTKTILKKIKEEYSIPYYHKYDKIAFCNYDNPFFLDIDAYSVKYEDMCNYFFENSNAEFKKEKGMDIVNNTLITNKSKHKFDLLIDCTGRSFFVRKKFKLPMSERFWIAKLKILKNNQNIKTNHMYWFTDEKGYFEEFCPYEDHIAVGDYLYSDKIDFSRIKLPEKLYRNKALNNIEIIKEFRAVIPSSPRFPLYYKKKIAFLGDSFGNAPTSSAYGSEAILETSKILSCCIINNNMHMYEKMWKKKYLDSYIKYLIVKYDMFTNSKFIKKIKNYPDNYSFFNIFKKYPEQVIKYLEDPNYVFECLNELSSENKFPKIQKLFRAYYYLFLHTRTYFESLRKF
jgi:flavin-dependent dehydrogenase